MNRASDPLSEFATALESTSTSQGDLVMQRPKREKIRRIKALSMLLAGMSYEQTGDQLNLSGDAVRIMIDSALQRTESAAAEKWRTLENARLDRAQMAIWPKVLKGDLRAVEVFLKLSARRARMNGLDIPMDKHLSISVRQEMEQALFQLEQTVLGEVIGEHELTEHGPLEQRARSSEREGEAGSAA